MNGTRGFGGPGRTGEQQSDPERTLAEQRQADKAQHAKEAAAARERGREDERDTGRGKARDRRLERPSLEGRRGGGRGREDVRERPGELGREENGERERQPAYPGLRRQRGMTTRQEAGVEAVAPGIAHPEAGDRAEMERELHGLLEAVGVRTNEQGLQRALDAWYGAPAIRTEVRLTPEQERVFDRAYRDSMDRSMAAAERRWRVMVKDLSTQDLINTATQLDAELFADETGPLLRREIARTLVAMHHELDQRLRDAPKDGGLPRLEGVTWDRDDPIAGIVEAIPPFGNIDLWTLDAQAPAGDEAESEGAPTEAQEGKRHPLDARERAERERIGQPEDGMGFAYNSDCPAPGEWQRFWPRNYSRLNIALLDPESWLVVRASASAPGTDRYNLALARRRAESVKALLVAHGIPEHRIVILNLGEGPARAAGWPPDRDNADDRVVRVTAAGGRSREIPNEEAPPPLKTDIPDGYRPEDRYSTARKEAARLADSPDEYYEKLRKLPRSIRGYSKALRTLAQEISTGGLRELIQIGDFTRWTREMSSSRSPDEKLWTIPPPKPLRTLKGHSAFRYVVDYQLKLGGYDPKKMYREYLIHWFRKGVR